MPEVMWTSPALEFHQKFVGTPTPSAVTFAPDLLNRWQPLLTGVEDGRREELVGILEFEAKLVAEIMGVAKWAEDFGVFLRNEKDWVAEDAGDQQHVLSYYHQAVKRKVLEQEARHFKAPVAAAPAPVDQMQEVVALRLAHRAEIEAWKRACEGLRTEVEAERRRADLERDKADDRHGKWVRTQADFDNYQKRVKRDLERDREAALRKILSDIVTVVDNAALVVENAGKPDATTEAISKALASGVQVELLATLARHGGKPMGVKPGDAYEPIRHEAVSVVAEDGPADRDEVLSVVREGYLIGAAILRAASVVVRRIKAPKPVAAPQPEAPATDAAPAV